MRRKAIKLNNLKMVVSGLKRCNSCENNLACWLCWWHLADCNWHMLLVLVVLVVVVLVVLLVLLMNN